MAKLEDELLESLRPFAKAIAEAVRSESPSSTEPPVKTVSAQLDASSSGEWNRGISKQIGRFLINDTPETRKAFVAGATVKFADGTTRKIASRDAVYNKLFVAVEGGMLNPDKVGHPNSVTVVEAASEEPDPEDETESPVGSGSVHLNLGLGQGGDIVLPGKHMQHYRFPQLDEWKKAAGQGFKRARVGFLHERALPGGAGRGVLDQAHLSYMHQTAEFAAEVGMTILWDMHNYTGYSTTGHSKDRKKLGSKEYPIEALGDDWKVLAAALMANKTTREVTYGFDIMNEPIVPWSVWRPSAQHAIDQIASVARDKMIIIEGIAYSSTINWVKNNPGIENLTHPRGKEWLEFHGHLYLDERASGFWDTAKDKTGKADPMLGVNRIKSFAEWGRKHGLKLGIGETMVPGIYPEFVEALDNLIAFNKREGIDTYVFFAAHGAGNNWHNINKPENEPTLDVILKHAM